MPPEIATSASVIIEGTTIVVRALTSDEALRAFGSDPEQEAFEGAMTASQAYPVPEATASDFD